MTDDEYRRAVREAEDEAVGAARRRLAAERRRRELGAVTVSMSQDDSPAVSFRLVAPNAEGLVAYISELQSQRDHARDVACAFEEELHRVRAERDELADALVIAERVVPFPAGLA